MTRPRWRATSPDGIAHAFHPRIPEARCGVRNQPEKFDWPTTRRCPRCQELEREVRPQPVAS